MTHTFPLLQRREGVRGGQPIVRETGVTVETIVDRFASGESIASIAEDFTGVDEREVLEAIRLVVCVKGTNIYSSRPREKVERWLPLETQP